MGLRPVGRALPIEVVLLHHALEAFALRATDNIDIIARLKLRHSEIHFAFRKIDTEAEFADEPFRFRVRALKDAELSFVNTRFFLRTEADLNGRVTVVVVRQATQKSIIARRDHGYRMEPTVGVVDAGHADFLS